MSLTIPDRDALKETVLAWTLGQITDLDISPDSPDGARICVLVELLFGLFAQIEAAQGDIWPAAGMPTESLERHAEIRLGPSPRLPATVSTGALALRVTGTLAGATVARGDTLVHNDGTRYQLLSGGTVGSGTLDVSVESIDTGTTTNKLIGDELTFESPPANISATATLVGNLTGGDDEETDAELLERVLQAFVNPPAGGRFSDYWRWARGVEGVADAYCYGPTANAPIGRRGFGIVDVAITASGTGAGRIPSALLAQGVNDVLESERPVGTKDTGALIPGADAQPCTVQFTPDDGYESDWGLTGAYSGTVSSYDASSKRINWVDNPLPASLTAALDAGLKPRIQVNGEVLVCVSYSAVTHSTVVETAPTVTPIVGDPICPGGPLTQLIVDEIKAYYDSLGPARGTAYDPNQVGWEDTLRPTQIASRLVGRVLSDGTQVGIKGCRDATVVSPFFAYTPTDHTPDGVPDLVVYPASHYPNCITVVPMPGV